MLHNSFTFGLLVTLVFLLPYLFFQWWAKLLWYQWMFINFVCWGQMQFWQENGGEYIWKGGEYIVLSHKSGLAEYQREEKTNWGRTLPIPSLAVFWVNWIKIWLPPKVNHTWSKCFYHLLVYRTTWCVNVVSQFVHIQMEGTKLKQILGNRTFATTRSTC